MKLTHDQKRAVNYPSGNLQLIACARSRKTEVVARRVANLVKPGPNALLPRNITAFTFTEKARDEAGGGLRRWSWLARHQPPWRRARSGRNG